MPSSDSGTARLPESPANSSLILADGRKAGRRPQLPNPRGRRGPLRALWRPGLELDNLALVPANLLPFKSKWQTMANSLAQRTTLIIIPRTDNPQRKVLQTVVTLLEADGHQVTTLPAERFT